MSYGDFRRVTLPGPAPAPPVNRLAAGILLLVMLGIVGELLWLVLCPFM